MKFLIQTQYMENYGEANDPYWKMKGGSDYIIEVDGFNFQHEMAEKKGEMIVDELLPKIEYRNDYSVEYMIGWQFVEDDFQTEFEKSQLEFDGEILYPAKRITYDELMAEA